MSSLETTETTDLKLQSAAGDTRDSKSPSPDGKNPGTLTSKEVRALGQSTIDYINRGIIAIRWTTVMIGLGFASSRASEGELRVVATLAITIFLTTWRSINPIQIDLRNNKIPLFFGCADVAILAAAIGVREGFSNPFVGCVFIAIAVVAFGWGLKYGLLAASIAIGVTSLVSYISEDLIRQPDLIEYAQISAFVVAIGVLPGVALKRILEMEGRGQALKIQRDRLAEANNLLEVLNELARTLPSSLDLADAVYATKQELTDAFRADRMALLAFENGEWVTLMQEGLNLPPKVNDNELPELIYKASRSIGVMVVNDLAQSTNRFGSGMYVRLIANNVDTGLIAVEHPETDHFTQTDINLLEGMADVLALTLANARSFNRLRSLAADEERTRIARDLHDRLGQYLTYIALELERIKGNELPSKVELDGLYNDVQSAISEFRDTLLELRAAVSPERPLNTVLKEVIERFEKRSKIEVDLQLAKEGRRLPSPIENELLRITQEALTNIEKHADASKVYIRWSISDDIGVLLINDDGRGFDPNKGIRGSAYGLVGMRERATAIGAHLEMTSEPGHGTNIMVQTRLTSK